MFEDSANSSQQLCQADIEHEAIDSSTEVLGSLHWKPLDFRRRFHQCATIYRSKKNDISYTFSNKTGKDLHHIQTRNNEQYHLPKVKTNRGKQV